MNLESVVSFSSTPRNTTRVSYEVKSAIYTFNIPAPIDVVAKEFSDAKDHNE